MASIKKNFIFNFLLSISQIVFPLITFPYITHILLPEDVGLVNFVDSFCRYIILFSALGIPIYGVREIAKVKDNINKLETLTNELVSINFILSIIFLFIFFIFVFTIQKLQINYKLYLIGSCMIISNVFSFEWYFQGIEEFKYITVRNIGIKIFLSVLTFFIIKRESDVIPYFLLTVLSYFITAVINFLHAKKNIKLKLIFNLNSLKKHFKPLLLIFSTIFFVSAYTLMDTLILGFLTDDKTVGIYTTGLKIAKIPMLFIGALGVVLIPRLSKSYFHNEEADFLLLINKSVNFVITFSLPIFFYIFANSNTIIYLIAGKNYSESAIVLQILSVLGILVGLSNIFGMQVLTTMSKDKYFTISVLAGTISSVLLNLLFIPKFKEIGSAFSNITSEVLVTIMTIYFASKFIKIKIDYGFIIKNILYGIPLLIIPKFLYINNISLFYNFVLSALISLTYFLIIQLFVIKNMFIVLYYDKLKKQLWRSSTI